MDKNSDEMAMEKLLSTTDEKEKPKSIDEVASRRIKIYNFESPKKFSLGHIRDISIIHECFSKNVSTIISSFCGCIADFHVASADELTYEEFTRIIPNPVCLGIFNMEPLKGNAIIAIDQEISLAMVNYLLGGNDNDRTEKYELTDIELSIMEDVIAMLLKELKIAWTTVLDINPKLNRIETNSYFIQVVPPTERVLTISIETKINNTEGLIYLCFPYVTLKPIMDKLVLSCTYTSEKIIEENNMGKNYMKEKNNVTYKEGGLDNVNINIICEIGRTVKTIGVTKKIEEGTVIELDKLAGEPIDIFANNVLIAKGEIVVIDENYGVKVIEVNGDL